MRAGTDAVYVCPGCQFADRPPLPLARLARAALRLARLLHGLLSGCSSRDARDCCSRYFMYRQWL